MASEGSYGPLGEMQGAAAGVLRLEEDEGAGLIPVPPLLIWHVEAGEFSQLLSIVGANKGSTTHIDLTPAAGLPD